MTISSGNKKKSYHWHTSWKKNTFCLTGYGLILVLSSLGTSLLHTSAAIGNEQRENEEPRSQCASCPGNQ